VTGRETTPMQRVGHLLFLCSIVLIPLFALMQREPVEGAAAASLRYGVASGPSAQGPAQSCSGRTMLLNYQDVRRNGTVRQEPIWHLPHSSAVFFSAGMTIDADGSPNAYGPDNNGLDDLSNAGSPGHWDGIIEDAKGEPIIQGPGDPFPGFYVSCTSLSDRTKKASDPARYVDASKIPYIVLPENLAREVGARLGDFAVVMNVREQKTSYAIFADVGTFGEGSVALADNLGIWSNARRGGRGAGLLYLVFPGSGNGRPRMVDQINSETEKVFQQWGGPERLTSCATEPESEIATNAPESVPHPTN
jgi:Fungal chitosanase of glycosyl hydrolase group 75